MSVERIISGGQTGADRGGLDAAITLGIPYGGWCPRGRIAEDGRVPSEYALIETASSDYTERTRKNVEDADGTAIFVVKMTRGSMATVMWCRRRGKPYIVIANTLTCRSARVTRLYEWLRRVNPRVLNVAGSRESKAPGIHLAVTEIVTDALTRLGR